MPDGCQQRRPIDWSMVGQPAVRPPSMPNGVDTPTHDVPSGAVIEPSWPPRRGAGIGGSALFAKTSVALNASGPVLDGALAEAESGILVLCRSFTISHLKCR
jgi:hypothetical protein